MENNKSSYETLMEKSLASIDSAYVQGVCEGLHMALDYIREWDCGKLHPPGMYSGSEEEKCAYACGADDASISLLLGVAQLFDNYMEEVDKP